MLNDYYYRKLNNFQQQIYLRFAQNVEAMVPRFDIRNIPNDETVAYILAEHPEFYFCNLREINYEILGNNIYANVDYVCDRSFCNMVRSKCDALIQTITDHLDDEELVVRFVHNYFVKNITYDYISGNSNLYDHMTHTIIGPFMQRKGVCEGLSLAFKYVLNKLRMECATVTGSLNGIDGALHMWNIVEINGRRYHIDITQDIAATRNEWGKPSYLFYLLTDAEMKLSHSWHDEFNCYSDTDSPFRKFKKTFENPSELALYINNVPINQRLIYFKYDSLIPKNDVIAIVSNNITGDKNYKKLSVVENAGRYYFYKEIERWAF